jgi:hypothetical protein
MADFEPPTLGYESIATLPTFIISRKQTTPERIAPGRVIYVPYELYVLDEVWQKSGKELVPRSERVFVAPIRSMTEPLRRNVGDSNRQGGPAGEA